MSTQVAPQSAPAKPSNTRRIRADRWFAFWLILPTIILVIGVSIYPYAIRTSLRMVNPSFGMDKYVGLQNYRTILTSDEFHKAMLVTARFAVASTVLSLVFGLIMALVLNQHFRGRAVLRSTILVPWAMSGTVVGVLWAWIYDGGYGTLNGVLYKVGLIDTYQAWLSRWDFGPIFGPGSLYLVVFAFVWNSAPMTALFLLAALQSVPQNLYSAAKMDGAGAIARFRYITLPWLRSMILLVLILASINGIMAFDLIYFLTKGGPGTDTTVFSWLGYNTTFTFFQFGQGTAILLMLTVICLILAFIYMTLLDRKPSQSFDLIGTGEASVEDLRRDLERRTTAEASAMQKLADLMDCAAHQFLEDLRLVAGDLETPHLFASHPDRHLVAGAGCLAGHPQRLPVHGFAEQAAEVHPERHLR